MSPEPAPSRPKTVAIIQARMGSSRFPGKVLEPLAGRPSIVFMAERVRRARTIDTLCVATSCDPSDDALAELVEGAGFPVFRGSLDDVLDRFLGAAHMLDAEIVVRLTGDCPLSDPDVIDRVVNLLVTERLDYASNAAPPTFPDGLDVEAMTMATLEEADRDASAGSDREHVTLFVRNHPERFRAGCIDSEVDCSDLRWTVDYPDDLELVRALVDAVADPVGADRFDFLRASDARRLSTWTSHARNEGLAASLAADAAAREASGDPDGP